tara:strand:- start:2335 stop:3654 length:1320 start_codon:yes stop_codon:yes gene_type:complete
MYLFKFAFICAFLFSISSAQNCQSIFESKTIDRDYWYGISFKELKRTTKIDKVSNEVLSGAISNLSSSIYSDVTTNYSVESKEKLSNSSSNFSEITNFNIDIFTKIYGIEYEIISQGKCDSQYYSLIRLNKKSFTAKQRSSLISSLDQFESLDSSNFSVLYDYLSFISDLYDKIDSNYFGLISSSYEKKASYAKNSLKNEYIKSLSSITPSFNYSIPYSIYDDRPNALKISFLSKGSNLSVINGKADIRFLERKNIFKFNSSGEIIIPIDLQIRNSSFVSMSIVLNFNDLLASHTLFKNLTLEDPKFSYTIKPQPLVLNFENNFENRDLSNIALNVLNNVLLNSISVQLKENVNAIYTLRVDILDYEKKFNKQLDTYTYLLDDVSFSLINDLNGYVIFTSEVGNLKGLSFIGYDEALNNLKGKLRNKGKALSEEIKINI